MSIKDEIERDTARLVSIDEKIDRLTEEKQLIAERMRLRLQEGQIDYGTHDAGEWSLVVGHNRTLNKEAFEQRFPVAQYPAYYKPVPNTQAIREHFAPVELDKWYVEGAAKIGVK